MLQPSKVAALLAVVGAIAACDKPSREGAPSAGPSGHAMGRPSGVEVLSSSGAKITEEAFMAALEKRLEATMTELGQQPHRSRMHLVADVGQRMQPQRIVREVSKDMGVSDVAVLSLFARSEGARTNVGKRVKEYADGASKTLMEQHGSLPMVVKQDCLEAAARSLILKDVAAGKRQPSPGDREAAPLVGVVLKECRSAAEQQPELKCLVDAPDEATLESCP